MYIIILFRQYGNTKEGFIAIWEEFIWLKAIMPYLQLFPNNEIQPHFQLSSTRKEPCFIIDFLHSMLQKINIMY